MLVFKLLFEKLQQGNQLKAHIGLLILRVSAAGMILTHGWGKLMNFSDLSTKFPDPIGLGSSASLTLAVFAEVFCAIALGVGFKSRWATIPLAITMIVAAFIIHASDPFGKQEKALLFLTMFVTLFLTGPGKYSVDGVMGKE